MSNSDKDRVLKMAEECGPAWMAVDGTIHEDWLLAFYNRAFEDGYTKCQNAQREAAADLERFNKKMQATQDAIDGIATKDQTP